MGHLRCCWHLLPVDVSQLAVVQQKGHLEHEEAQFHCWHSTAAAAAAAAAGSDAGEGLLRLLLDLVVQLVAERPLLLLVERPLLLLVEPLTRLLLVELPGQ